MGQMNRMWKRRREKLVGEYLAGGVSYRDMEDKYGIAPSTLQRWVLSEEKKAGRSLRTGPEKVRAVGSGGSLKGDEASREERPEVLPREDLVAEVRELREKLKKAELHNKLLNAMIDIAEEQLEVPIRKKSGARQ